MLLYRYEQVRYASGLDENESPIGPPRVDVCLRVYTVVRESEKSYWIVVGSDGRRVTRGRLDDLLYPPPKRMSRTAKRLFAHDTKEEALAAFIERKKAHVRILRGRLEDANVALDIAQGRVGREDEVEPSVSGVSE